MELALLEPCRHYFSVSGAAWAHFAHLAALVIVHGRFWCVLVRARLDFGGVLEAPDMVLEVRNDDFCYFVHAHEVALRKCSDPYKTLAGGSKNRGFLHIGSAARTHKNDIKSFQEPSEQSFPPRSC